VQFKDLIGLAFFAGGISGGVVMACLSQRIRDVFFIAMLCLIPMTELYDVNFVSRDFYRGTVRGFEVSLVDILSVSILLGSILAPRAGEKRLYWVPSLGFIVFYFFYCVFNVAIADPKLFGMFELSKIVRGIVMFLAVAMYVRSEREVKIALFAIAGIICYESLLALRQRYLWGVHRVFGSMEHSNSLAALFCVSVPVFVAAFNSRAAWYLKALCAAAIAMAAVGVILTISRAGVVILAFGIFCTILATMSFKITFRKGVIAMVLFLGAAGLVAKSWETLKERFTESSLDEEYAAKHNQGRGYYLRLAKAIAVDRAFGVGLNNWSYWVSNQYGPRLGYMFNPYRGTDREPNYDIPEGVTNIDDAQAAPAHNLGALTLGELGIPGLIVFALLWLRWFQMGAYFLWPRTPDLWHQVGAGIFFSICCMFLQSITEWVFRHSPIFYMFHVLLGMLASFYYMKRQARKIEVARARTSFEDQIYAPARPTPVVESNLA
jgi:hypothetical protein